MMLIDFSRGQQRLPAMRAQGLGKMAFQQDCDGLTLARAASLRRSVDAMLPRPSIRAGRSGAVARVCPNLGALTSADLGGAFA